LRGHPYFNLKCLIGAKKEYGSTAKIMNIQSKESPLRFGGVIHDLAKSGRPSLNVSEYGGNSGEPWKVILNSGGSYLRIAWYPQVGIHGRIPKESMRAIRRKARYPYVRILLKVRKDSYSTLGRKVSCGTWR